jgi:hypothetical protein
MPVELACRDPDRQAPFDRIGRNPSDCIDVEYMPTGIFITDPRSMKLDSLIKFFQHVARREDSHGISNAFRFHSVFKSRKQGEKIRARYIYDGDDPGSPITPPPVPRKRRKAPVYTPNTSMLNPEISEEASGDPRTSNESEIAPATSARAVQPLPTPARAVHPLAVPARAPPSPPSPSIIKGGLITPVDTPGPSDSRKDSSSPQPRNRGRKTKHLVPTIEPPDESSMTERRRSPRSSMQATASPVENPKSKKKSKITKKKIGVCI